MENQARSDKGKVRKVVLEDVAEAIRQVLPKVHGKTPSRALLYRLCIEAGLLTRSQIAPNTFRRVVKQYELLKPDRGVLEQTATGLCQGPRQRNVAGRHALRALHSGQGVPRCKPGSSPSWMTPRAFVATASSSPAENVDTLIEALRAAFYKRGVPQCPLCGQRIDLRLQRNHPNLRPRRLSAPPHARARRRRQGKNRTVLPHRARPVPRPRAGSVLARGAQPPVHRLGRGTLQRPKAFGAGHDARWTALRWTEIASASCRPTRPTTNCSSSRKSATSAPTTPSPSRSCASKPRATCPTAPSRSASSVRSPRARRRLLQRRTHGRSPSAQPHRQ